jgi:hypothetical protein
MPLIDPDSPQKQSRADSNSAVTAIVSSKQLGDVTLLEPMTRFFAARTGTPVAMFVKEAFRPLIDLMPEAQWGPDLRQPIKELWATSWGGKTALKAFKLRAKQKILLHNKIEQRRWWYRWVFNEFIIERHALEYWGHYFWRMAGGASEDFKSSVLVHPPTEWRFAEMSEEAYVVIVPTSAWPEKQWGVAQWADLALKLKQDLNCPRKLVMLGGNQEFEKDHCRQIERLTEGRVENLCGRTSLKEYLHILAGSKAVVTVDGSASHLAQAFGRPVVTIFGPTQDQRWHYATPRHECLSARHFSIDKKNAPASLVPVSSVMDALARVIQT